MKLVALTAPDGSRDLVNPDQVVDVKLAGKGVYDPRANTVITLSNGFRAVRESPAEVLEKLGVT